MAYVKTTEVPIKVETHLVNTIDYVVSKAYQASFMSFKRITEIQSDNSDLTATNIADEYRKIRKAFDKNDKRISYHLVQSFSNEDNVSLDEAHQIALEFAEKCLSNFQVTIATHNDSGHIHNHFIINSVSPFDGMKFVDNNTNINLLRRESDKICLAHGLGIIENDVDVAKYNGLDNSTKQCQSRGESWKFRLAKDLDEALKVCKNENEFRQFFKDRDYTIRWTSKNITFKHKDAGKGIRADTLAKQFGMKYSKANIERHLFPDRDVERPEFQRKIPVIAQPDKYRSYEDKAVSREWKRYEKKYSKNLRFTKSMISSLLFSRNPLEFTIKLILHIFFQSKNKHVGYLNRKNIKSNYKVKSYNDYRNKKQVVGNLPMNELKNSVGDLKQIKLYSWQLARLCNNGVLCVAKIDLQSGVAIVTLKAHDIGRAERILNLNAGTLEKQSQDIYEKKFIRNINANNTELARLKVSDESIDKLRMHCFDFTVVDSDNGEKLIYFAKEDKPLILNVLYPNRKEKNKDSFFKKNADLNRKLKAKAEQQGVKLKHKVVVNSQYALLKETNIEFAVFKREDGKYNLVYLPETEEEINSVLGINKDDKVQWLLITEEQLCELEKTDLSFKKFTTQNDKIRIRFKESDSSAIKKAVFKSQNDFFVRNSKINSELKIKAKAKNQKLLYRVIDKESVSLLENSDIEAAVFRKKDGNFNIVFLEESKTKIDKLLGGDKPQNNIGNSKMKL